MLIDLASVTATPRNLEAIFAPHEIDLDGENARLAENAEFHGEMQRVAGKAHIRGTISATVATNCSRCLEPVTRHFEIAFDDVFVDASEEPATAEAEIAEGELDESLVIGGRVDTAEIVREQLLLAVPEHVLCREDCKGLCPKCGRNLNLIDCNCADDDIDPRWAALKNLN